MKVRIPNANGGMNQQQMLKKVQQMQEDMAVLQADLDQREYTATAGGDMVSVTVTGKHEVKSIKIKPEALEECDGDPEMLEDFLIIALNEAIGTATSTSEKEMGALTSGLNIPGLPGMF
ncbi:MAG: YbaB/EbfC family nucleoid-associated protein [Acutalibacteraceae bacterium]|nr:YbaB/EbfC family nucleoid-associated protein [Acutalibacteraceae bacterium]